MFKKKIALFVTCFMLFSVFSAFLCDETSAAEGDYNYYESREILQALDITNGIDLNAADTVTRNEFVALTMRMINVECGEYKFFYNDVSADDSFAAEISEARIRGVASGVSEYYFGSGNAITYSQALAMIIKALGYGDLTELYGGYPVGYYALANELKITKNVGGTLDTELNAQRAYILIANTLKSKFINASGIKSGNPDDVIKYSESDLSVMQKYFDIHVADGVVWGIGNKTMRSSAPGDEKIDISGDTYFCNGDYDEFLGLHVKALLDSDDKIVGLIESNKNTVTEIASEDISGFSSNRLKAYDENGKALTFSFDAGYILLKNYKIAFNPDFKEEDAIVRLIDNNSDGKIDVAHILSPEYIIVSSVDDSVVYDKNGKTIGGKQGVEIDSLSFYSPEGRKKISPSALPKNMVVGVYVSEDGEITDALCGYDVMYGATVTATEGNDIFIDDVRKTTNSYFKKYFKDIYVGMSLTVYYDEKGRICFAEKYTGDGIMKYGYFLSMKFGKGFNKTQMLVLTESNERKTFDICDKILFDGENLSSSDAKITNTFLNGDIPKYQLIKYGVDKNGLISKIDTLTDVDENAETEEKYFGASVNPDDSLTRIIKNKGVIYRAYSEQLFPYAFTDNAVIFEVPKNIAGDNHSETYDFGFFRARIKPYSDNDKFNADMFDFNEKFGASAIVAYSVAASGSSSVPDTIDPDSDNVEFVKDVVKTVDKNGNITLGVVFAGSGKTHNIVYDLLDYYKQNNYIPKAGDFIQYSLNENGELNGFNLATYDKATRSFGIDYSKVGSSVLHDTTFIAGKIYSVSDKHIALKASVHPGAFSGVSNPDDKIFILSKYSNLPIYIFNTKTNETKLGSIKDIKSIKDAGDGADDIMIELDWGSPNQLAVYTR